MLVASHCCQIGSAKALMSSCRDFRIKLCFSNQAAVISVTLTNLLLRVMPRDTLTCCAAVRRRGQSKRKQWPKHTLQFKPIWLLVKTLVPPVNAQSKPLRRQNRSFFIPDLLPLRLLLTNSHSHIPQVALSGVPPQKTPSAPS